MAKKKKHGGARKGAGRPQVEDKAQPITLYVLESRIEVLGKEEIKVDCLEMIEKKYKKAKKK